ncbi:NmrA family NAD(P)-binding protein [Pseudodesulfovibrio sp. zrk46]|uniref:NmrA family NAD(P)-binding protein n=1 Tax=Pseudodesulfovibrio sp. zrk46 TaxID=2725288 RepID=UPI001449E2AB|nr:NmrA family NAD(P)-binding protein [Pseudodesulfovibrio sp. zrk46]QJB55607.1 NmrA family NAD(P)-binding protein [Pseudodesulfovibrio sp. zrk46]
MSKVFVAGAAGNIGRALLAELKEKNLEAVAGVHSEDKAAAISGEGVEARIMEFSDQASMEKAMAGCDKMFLVLPLTETMSRFGHLAVEAAKAAGIEYIVRSSGYASSSDAHWRLGREQGMVDQFVEDSGIPFTILRPNSFMQNFSGPMADMVKAGFVGLAEEEAKVSYIDVRDIAACAATLLNDVGEHANKFYALTGPEGLSGADVATKLSAAAGKEIVYRPMEEEVFAATLKENGIPEWNVNMLISLARIVKLGMIGNVTKAVEYLTDTPARTFDAFAEENAAIWR